MTAIQGLSVLGIIFQFLGVNFIIFGKNKDGQGLWRMGIFLLGSAFGIFLLIFAEAFFGIVG